MNKAINNERGVTLIEMIIASGIAIALILTAAIILSNVVSIGAKQNINLENEASVDTLIHILQQEAMMGVNVRFAGNIDLNGTRSSGDEGYVRSIDYTQLSDYPGSGSIVTLAYFAVENSGTGPSDFGGFGIFFREPTDSVPGAILLQYSDTLPFNFNPVNAQVSAEGIVALRLDNAYASPNGVLESIDLTFLRRRYVESGMDRDKMSWCPQPDLGSGGCPGATGYADVQRKVVLEFSNNKRDTSESGKEFGRGIYFFRPNRE